MQTCMMDYVYYKKKTKDLGRCKGMLFLDTDNFHTRVCEHKYLVFLFEYSHFYTR